MSWINSCTIVGWGSGLSVPNRISADETRDLQFLIFRRKCSVLVFIKQSNMARYDSILDSCFVSGNLPLLNLPEVCTKLW